MHCANCGSNITEQQKFCGACGSSTTGQNFATPQLTQGNLPSDRVLLQSPVPEASTSGLTARKFIVGAICIWACLFGQIVLPQLLQPAAAWVGRVALPILAICCFVKIISKRIKIGFLILVVVLVFGIDVFEEARVHDREGQAAANIYKANLLMVRQEKDAFEKMTLPQHLSTARGEVTTKASPEQIIDGRRHIEALHGTPLEGQGIALLKQYEAEKRSADRAASALALQNQKKEQAYAEVVNTSLRIAMAKTVENAMLADGYNVDVNAIGTNHTTLRIKWIGVSKVMAYQMSQQPETFETARKNGFKKLVITDGYDETWTWTL